MKYVVTHKLDGFEYADKDFETYAMAKDYADKLIKRYKTQYKPEQYEVLILDPYQTCQTGETLS